MNTHFPKDTWMANEYMKMCPVPPITSKMKIKTMMKYHLTLA